MKLTFLERTDRKRYAIRNTGHDLKQHIGERLLGLIDLDDIERLQHNVFLATLLDLVEVDREYLRLRRAALPTLDLDVLCLGFPRYSTRHRDRLC